ncbi:MAG: hypothetical protein PF795_02780 [Kiritimatiellae bacterium]|jgi:hypothetical protein|nr:hypothetical protein [Kiritimatiellia bacterium]
MKRLHLNFVLPSWKLCLMVLASLPMSGKAVIIAGGTGSGNTTAPVGDQGWSYVGQVKNSNSASATYVGNNWFLTAWHVRVLDNPTQVNLGGVWYDIDAGSWSRLSSGGNDADAGMFRVTSPVPMADVVLYNDDLFLNDPVTMTGYGRNRASTGTTWYVDEGPNPDSWSETNTGVHERVETGFKWAPGTTKRWGTNELAGAGGIDTGYGFTQTVYTTFDDNGNLNEAQGATFDSGGGVFINDDGIWSLTGMMVTVSGFNGQPSSTSVYGNRTYFADLRVYHDQIMSVIAIPELGTFWLSFLFFGTFVAVTMHRRR